MQNFVYWRIRPLPIAFCLYCDIFAPAVFTPKIQRGFRSLLLANRVGSIHFVFKFIDLKKTKFKLKFIDFEKTEFKFKFVDFAKVEFKFKDINNSCADSNSIQP